MQLMIAGFATLAFSVVLFAMLLPRHGKTHRFVDTELEPYIAVGLTSLVALSFTMILSGALNVLG
jgi:hypothetical protein